MRALCGAIITAGVLIGLGLASVGVGLRYQLYPYHNQAGQAQWVEIKHLDSALMLALSALLIALVIGMVIAFVGLAYHHHRRFHEFRLEQSRAAAHHHPTTV